MASPIIWWVSESPSTCSFVYFQCRPRNHLLSDGWLFGLFIYSHGKAKSSGSGRSTEIYLLSYIARGSRFRPTNGTFTLGRLSRIRSRILWVPFVDVVLNYLCKDPVFLAYHNVVGNIVWFIPARIFSLLYGKEKGHSQIRFGTGSGPLCHRVLSIIFYTGVNHIDDILCNVFGSWIPTVSCHYEMEENNLWEQSSWNKKQQDWLKKEVHWSVRWTWHKSFRADEGEVVRVDQQRVRMASCWIQIGSYVRCAMVKKTEALDDAFFSGIFKTFENRHYSYVLTIRRLFNHY